MAILLVVLYHAHVGWLSGGFCGVDVFFVISGFLITRQLVRELQGTGSIDLPAFYARRIRRIIPGATLVTATTVIASALLLAPLAARRVFGDVLAAVCFGANFRFAAEGANYFDSSLPPSPLQHFWSLSVEEQFYVVWPLLLLIASLAWARRRRAAGDGGPSRPAFPVVLAVLGAVTAFSLWMSIHQTPESPSWAYYSILSRAWELAAGALIALGLPLLARAGRRPAAALTWLGLAAIAVAAIVYGPATPYPGFEALLPVLGATAVIAGGVVASAAGAERVLRVAPLQLLGRWSYSWYLWHWPALILAPAVLGHALSEPEALAVAALSLIPAVLSYTLVERPLRRVQVIVRRPALGLFGGGALAAATLGVVVIGGSLVAPLTSRAATSRIWPRATTSLTAAKLAADLDAAARSHRVPSGLQPPLATAAKALPLIVTNGCHLQHAGLRSKPCVYGDVHSATTVVLFGDSHAATWFPALQQLSDRDHWRLVILTKAGCPPVEVNIALTTQGHTPYPQCDTWRRNAEAQIAALHPALVVVSWARYLEYPEASALAGVPATTGSAWGNGVAAIFGFLRGAAAHVVFISDTPTLAQLDPDCVSAHLTSVQRCATSRRAATLRPQVKQQEIALARAAHIDVIDPISWFCSPTTCPAVVGDILLFRDNAHMVPTWSRFIAPVLGDALRPIMSG